MKKIIVFVLVFVCSFLVSFKAFAVSESTAGSRQNTLSKPPYVLPTPKPYSERSFKVEASDGQLIYAVLSYPKTKLKKYPTVILLNSIGRTNNSWKPLKIVLNNAGFAVLRMDFRGHGQSVYDKSFRQRSWITYKHSDFEKFPSDVIAVIDKVEKTTKKADFSNYSIVGCDIGANTAVIVAKEFKYKPKALVLMSPQMTFKGLYIPIALTEIGNAPILSITSKTNLRFVEEQTKLSKFAQGIYDVYNTEAGGADVYLFKQYPELPNIISDWIKQYLK